jgi:hypothetical protein
MPAIIRNLLSRLRGRERFLGFAWAVARAVAVCVLLLILCCGLDWLIDRYSATPFAVRVLMLNLQVLLAIAGLVLIALPLVKYWSDDALALWIEDRTPSLGHRLISAVQLNRAGAKTAGMSPELIAATTRQAEEQAAGVDLTQVCEGSRLKWAGMVLAPILLLAAGLYLAMPSLANILLSRQMLCDDEIPRRVHLKSTTIPVWAVGEEGVIRIKATGLYDGEEPAGSVRVSPDVGASFTLPLKRDGEEFIARVPPGDGSFAFRAWLADGRLHAPVTVRYAPRPVAQTVRAWVQLHPSINRRRDGSPYEEEQRGGDVQIRIDGSVVRVAITSQVPLASGQVVFQGVPGKGAKLSINSDGMGGECSFVPPADMTGYEVRLTSLDELESADPPKRTIRRVALEAPEVMLLGETFFKKGDRGTADDWEVEGIPVLEGERFRTDYRATHRYGLSHARMRFRVIPLGAVEEGGSVDLDAFNLLPLGPGRGAKGEVAPQLQREFGTESSDDPNALPATEGRGTYDFNVSSLPDGKGGTMRLRKGDRIQFYIEVFSKAAPDGPPGRSVLREKEVVDEKGYFTWLERKDDLKERTRALEESARTTRPVGEE